LVVYGYPVKKGDQRDRTNRKDTRLLNFTVTQDGLYIKIRLGK